MCIALEHLFDYDDFRKFLQDYFEEQKKMRSVFSHRFFAAKAGFSSSSYCLNVIRGRFNLTPKSIEKISKAMEFEPLQKTYFEALVQYNQAQQVDERENAWNQIVQILHRLTRPHHHDVVHELSDFMGGKHDLVDDFPRFQVPHKAVPSAFAEDAAHGASNLRGDADCVALRGADEHGFNRRIVRQCGEPVDGLVIRAENLLRLQRTGRKTGGESFPQLLREIRHLLELDCESLVEPLLNLLCAECGEGALFEPGEELVWFKAAYRCVHWKGIPLVFS